MNRIPDMGIYAIENVLTGRCYVGRSIQLSVRMQKHETGLIQLNHENDRIREDVRRDGPEAFRVVVLQRTNDAYELEHLEFMWARRLNALPPEGYNGMAISVTAGTRKPTPKAEQEFYQLLLDLRDRGMTGDQIRAHLKAHDVARPTGGKDWTGGGIAYLLHRAEARLAKAQKKLEQLKEMAHNPADVVQTVSQQITDVTTEVPA